VIQKEANKEKIIELVQKLLKSVKKGYKKGISEVVYNPKINEIRRSIGIKPYWYDRIPNQKARGIIDKALGATSQVPIVGGTAAQGVKKYPLSTMVGGGIGFAVPGPGTLPTGLFLGAKSGKAIEKIINRFKS